MSTSKSRKLRDLIAQGCVMMPGVPNAAMARLVARVGFDAVYVSGAGLANSTGGVPDIGLLTMDEVVRLGADRGKPPLRPLRGRAPGRLYR